MLRSPRILDFTRPLEGLRAARDLAWPCHAFRVTVPIRTHRSLNIFEWTVLRLLQEARYEEAELADTTGLDLDLVTLVCSCLRDKALIDKDNNLNKLSAGYLESEEDLETEYEVRFVLRELVTGTMLPFMLQGELTYEELLEWRANQTTVRDRWGRPIVMHMLSDLPGTASPPPSPEEVWRVARHHAELSRQYAILRKDAIRPPRFTGAQRINIGHTPEIVFLRCRAVILAADDDYRIADPFGFGYSDALRKAFEGLRATHDHEQNFIVRLREEAETVKTPKAMKYPQAEAARNSILEEFSRGVEGYETIFEKLIEAEQDFRASISPPKNRDEAAQFDYFAMKTGQSLVAVLETALGQVVTSFRVPVVEGILAGAEQTYQENRSLLEGFAERLGFETGRLGYFLQVYPGRIRALREHADVDLQALTAICLMAAMESPEHPFHSIANKFPAWLEFLNELKRVRDAGLHGQNQKALISKLHLLRKRTYRTIRQLIPGLSQGAFAQAPDETNAVLVVDHDGRRKAIAQLEAALGVNRYRRLSRDTSELLIQVERSLAALGHGEEPQEVNRLVSDLASVLQTTLHFWQAIDGVGSRRDQDLLALARDHAIAAGMLEACQNLPRCLETVNIRRLQETIQGQNLTLGANVVALLVLAPGERLRQLAEAAPGFLNLVARVVELRGHGNKAVWLPSASLKALKEEVYSVCITFMES